MVSKELIERLRADAESTDDIGLCADAADRIEELERKVASRDAEVAKLKDDNEYLYVAAIERDQLREQVALLREEVTRCRDWFEAQAKVKSKGSPSSWELMLLRDERDAADEALAATKPK